jgi:hypothetical protein
LFLSQRLIQVIRGFADCCGDVLQYLTNQRGPGHQLPSFFPDPWTHERPQSAVSNATQATKERREVMKTPSGSHFRAGIDRGESLN